MPKNSTSIIDVLPAKLLKNKTTNPRGDEMTIRDLTALAMAMVVSPAMACSPQPTKEPKATKVVKISPKTFKHKTFKQWEAMCDAVEKCPRNVVEGMSQTATTFDEYESTCYWTQQHTMTLLQEKVLKGMLRTAVNDRHFELIIKYAEEGTNSTIKKEAKKRLKQLVAP